MNTIAADDPRADNPTYVAVCRTCGGWQYLADAADADAHADMKRDVKRAAGRAIERGSDFKRVRFGEIDLTMCECGRKARPAEQGAMGI